MCINGGFRSSDETNAGLEIFVPGKSGSSVELQVRIDDWNGRRINNSDYRITINPAAE